ncbi:hypothetical protein SARC_15707 [Sphaeroforma arctica JP610]|uniref:Uncharacterized protein n=1 Tax=Sphaeroforma arctica JP610 TaxID=667725 RepID=A0A0L0F6H4_9EUKA|nr:hypothetical protein SARC_15707 [Sphaeroforma arctica JP610]KNC71753.1 hypothetical protein SARC_15707 [Sphaeroforma arctica JP610]|eukprot:XP_014145655.1 hypothetical protein SARC_15707 [Sphaeroforma arctica JP610]
MGPRRLHEKYLSFKYIYHIAMGLKSIYPAFYVAPNNPTIAVPETSDFTGESLMTSDQYRRHVKKHEMLLPQQQMMGERRGAQNTKRYVGTQPF